MLYSVTVRRGYGGALIELSAGNYDVIIEFAGYDEDGYEIYEIETGHNIDRWLDLSEVVLSYSVLS